MKYLYIDTTSNYLYTALVDNDKLLCEEKIELGHEMSVKALSYITGMLDNNEIEPGDVDKIILVVGPGSFTGCRIGITIAKVYAWSMKIPITTISSLEAMTVVKENCEYYVPLIDARRGFVYAGIYDSNYNSIMRDQYVKLDVLEMAVSNTSDNYLYITNDDIELNGDVKKYDPDILKIVLKYKDRESVNPHGVDALYLKITEAEEKLNDSRS